MSVTLYLDNRPSRKTGEHPIRVQVSVRGVTLVSTIGHSVSPANWKDSRVKPKSYTNAKGVSAAKINDDLEKIISHFSHWEMGLKEKPDKEELKRHLKEAVDAKEETNPVPAKVRKVGFFTRLDEFIKEESTANGWAYATMQCWKPSSIILPPSTPR